MASTGAWFRSMRYCECEGKHMRGWQPIASSNLRQACGIKCAALCCCAVLHLVQQCSPLALLLNPDAGVIGRVGAEPHVGAASQVAIHQQARANRHLQGGRGRRGQVGQHAILVLAAAAAGRVAGIGCHSRCHGLGAQRSNGLHVLLPAFSKGAPLLQWHH